MDGDFWRRKWRGKQLGWHQPVAHPMLIRHLSAFGLRKSARVFVPLCGKSLDIHWLLANGFEVAGAELVESAAEQLFSELRVAPTIRDIGRLKRYEASGIVIFVGDLFDLDAQTLGAVDAVYDRAALVALPAVTRKAYAAHVAKIASAKPQLLITFDYDQSRMDGPPFSVGDDEARRLTADVYDATLLESVEVDGGLKGVCPAMEKAWMLMARG